MLPLTCHVAVDQLRPDWSASVHVDVKVSRHVAAVLVGLAGLLVHSWEENNEISCGVNQHRRRLTDARRSYEGRGRLHTVEDYGYGLKRLHHH